MKLKLLAASTALGAFLASGPLQHFGVLPQTVVGDVSKAAIKAVLDVGTTPAFASCGGNQGNNGFGNGGGDGVPGHSGFPDGNR